MTISLSQAVAPPWAPPLHTVEAVAAGVHWDAIAAGQDLGLAALSVLDQETNNRPGPVIWDTRSPRLYFLVPPDAPDLVDLGLGVRRLSHGAWVAVPGLDIVDPASVCWIAPPAPDAPENLVDPLRLAAALRHAATAQWVTRNVGGRTVEILASADQLAGEACIVCRTSRGPLHPDGVLTIPGDGDGVDRDFDVVVCTAHLGIGRG